MNAIQPSSGNNVAGQQQLQMTQSVADGAPVTDLGGVVGKVLSFGNTLIYIFVAAAVVYIVYYIVRYLIASNSEPKEKREAMKNIGWGILGLAIIVSLFGLVNIVVSSFRTTTAGLPGLPNADFVHNQ